MFEHIDLDRGRGGLQPGGPELVQCHCHVVRGGWGEGVKGPDKVLDFDLGHYH